MVDRSLAYARVGDFKYATASFISDRNKTGAGSPMDLIILQSYEKDQKYDHFAEGLLGFFNIH